MNEQRGEELMTLERDAAFLAGFIVGTYDLRGDAGPPAYIQPFLDRVLKATIDPAETVTPTPSTPKPAAPPEPELPALTRHMLEKANEPSAPRKPERHDYDTPRPVMMGHTVQNESLRDDSVVDPEPAPEDEINAVSATQRKTRKPWSPEARAAQAERLRGRIAAGKFQPGKRKHPRSDGIADMLAKEEDPLGEFIASLPEDEGAEA